VLLGLQNSDLKMTGDLKGTSDLQTIGLEGMLF
jgi:hypothetical protein